MSKRHYLCQIIGDGATPETAYRPAIADVTDPSQGGLQAYNLAVQMPASDPATGEFTKNYCFVVAAGLDHALVRGNADIDELFGEAGDLVKLGSINKVAKNSALAAMAARGVDTGRFNNNMSVREVLDRVGKDLEPTFDIARFDVSE